MNTNDIQNKYLDMDDAQIDNLLLGLDLKQNNIKDENKCINCKGHNLVIDSMKGYVVCEDCSVINKEFLDESFGLVGLDWKKHVEISEKYFRPAEVDLLIGDSTKARQKLGWKPKVDFKGLVKMMVESDLEKVGIKL